MFKNNLSNNDYTIVKDHVKFPTFADDDLNREIKNEFTFETLKVDLEKNNHFFTLILEKMDFLFDESKYKQSDELKKSLEIHKLNYISLRLTFTFYDRQFNLFYKLLNYNKTKDNVIMNEIISFYNTNEEDFKINFFNKYPQYNNKNSNQYTIQLLDELITKEKNINKLIMNLGEKYLPGFCTLNIAIKLANKILVKITENLDNLILNKDIEFSSYTEKDLLPLYSNLNKIETCGPLLSYLYFRGEDDIFNIKEETLEWENLKNKLFRVMILPEEEIKKKTKHMTEMVNVGYAALSKASENQDLSELIFKAKSGMLMAYYYFNTEKATHQSMRFLIKPDLSVTQKIWNILDTKEVSTAMKVILPYISYCKKFYLKRTKKPISMEEIDYLVNILNDKNFNINNLNINNKPNEKINIQFEGLDNKIINLKERDNSKNQINDIYLEKFPSKEIKRQNKSKYVKIKVIHTSEIHLIDEEPSFLDYLNCCSLTNKVNETRDSIIIHIHGGGFVAMSPSSHESYTRKWSKILNIPVFSIDYRLSPEYAFPYALDDVYQVYCWIIENCEEIFNIKLKNIILVGDSAGGNLALSLCYILIMKNIRLPNAIFLAYPALKLSINPLSLSYINSLTDPILECSLLIFCLKSYCGDIKDQKNPFLSPLYMKNDILKLLPPIRIFGGTSDPLRDDYVEFMNKCVKCNIDCKMEEYMFFPHGFLNYDVPMMFPEASAVTQRIAEEMENFIF